MTTTLEKLKPIIAQQLGCDESLITETTNLAEDLGVDSLDSVELIMAVEDEFGIDSIDEEKAETLKTVADLVKFIDEEAAK